MILLVRVRGVSRGRAGVVRPESRPGTPYAAYGDDVVSGEDGRWTRAIPGAEHRPRSPRSLLRRTQFGPGGRTRCPGIGRHSGPRGGTGPAEVSGAFAPPGDLRHAVRGACPRRRRPPPPAGPSPTPRYSAYDATLCRVSRIRSAARSKVLSRVSAPNSSTARSCSRIIASRPAATLTRTDSSPRSVPLGIGNRPSAPLTRSTNDSIRSTNATCRCGHEVAAALLADREQVGLPGEQPLDDRGDVARPCGPPSPRRAPPGPGSPARAGRSRSRRRPCGG